MRRPGVRIHCAHCAQFRTRGLASCILASAQQIRSQSQSDGAATTLPDPHFRLFRVGGRGGLPVGRSASEPCALSSAQGTRPFHFPPYQTTAVPHPGGPRPSERAKWK